MGESALHRPGPVLISVNTRPYEWGDKKISFEQLVALAFPGQPVTDDVSLTIRFTRGHDGHGAGTLTSGHDVPVKEGMVFHVARTTRS